MDFIAMKTSLSSGIYIQICSYVVYYVARVTHELFLCERFLKQKKGLLCKKNIYILPTVVRSILSRRSAMATMIKTIFLDSLQPENQVAQGHPEITSPTAVISSPSSCVVLYTTTSKPVGQPTSISIILLLSSKFSAIKNHNSNLLDFYYIFNSFSFSFLFKLYW